MSEPCQHERTAPTPAGSAGDVEALAEVELSIEAILTNWTDGDGIGWPAKFAWIRTFRAAKIAALTIDVAANGFREPIYLGYDGRVWDGHHRLAVAEALNWKSLPVLHGTEDDSL